MATVMAITEGSEGSRRPATGTTQGSTGKEMRARTKGHLLRQPVFNRRAKDEYIELKHIKMGLTFF